MKKQKGITLIVLIITIIVMLILVGVSVSVALNGGLFKTAKEAADKTKTAVQEESSLKYEYEIAKATGEFTGSYDEYPLYKKYGLKIGDKVNYDESDGTPLAYETDASKGTGVSYNSSTKTLVQGKYTLKGTGVRETKAGDLEWRVLGINDEGQVELISTTPTECELTLYGKAGYFNAVTENGVRGTLDTFCNNIYGKGTGAESARSLTIEDIYKLWGKEFKTETHVIKSAVDPSSGKKRFWDEDCLDDPDWPSDMAYGYQCYGTSITYPSDGQFITAYASETDTVIIENATYYTYFDNSSNVLPDEVKKILAIESDDHPSFWLASLINSHLAGNYCYSPCRVSYKTGTPVEMVYSSGAEDAFSSRVRSVVTMKKDLEFKYDKDTELFDITESAK